MVSFSLDHKSVLYREKDDLKTSIYDKLRGKPNCRLFPPIPLWGWAGAFENVIDRQHVTHTLQ